MSSQTVIIDYTNWKGERALRTIVPDKVYWGSNEWHTEEQWLLQAEDVEKSALRSFSMKDIHSWKSID